MKRLSIPLLILIFIILIDLVLVVVYFERGALSSVLNSVIPGPKVSAVSEVKGVNFTIVDEKLLIQELTDTGFFDKGRVTLFGNPRTITVKKVIFRLVNTEQKDDRIDGLSGNTVSTGQNFDSKTNVMAVNLYFSPSYIAQKDSATLSKDATTNIMYYIDSMTGHTTQNATDFMTEFGKIAQQSLKKGILFSVRKE